MISNMPQKPKPSPKSSPTPDPDSNPVSAASLAALLPRFRFLKHGLSIVLIMIGLRMLAEHWIEVSTGWMLVAVCGVLGVAIAASLMPFGRREPPPE